MTNKEESDVQKSTDKSHSRRTRFVSGFIVGITVALYLSLVAAIAHGLFTGWLMSLWNEIRPAQASIVVGGLTVLASLTAAVLLPFMLETRMREVNDIAREAKAYLKGDLRRTTEEANRILKVMERQAYRAEGILKPGQEIQVRDNDHANELIVELYEAARSYCHRLLKDKKWMRQSVRDEIADLQDMSQSFLIALKDHKVLTDHAYDTVEEVRSKRRAWASPTSGFDVNRLNKALTALLQEEDRENLPESGS